MTRQKRRRVPRSEFGVVVVYTAAFMTLSAMAQKYVSHLQQYAEADGTVNRDGSDLGYVTAKRSARELHLSERHIYRLRNEAEDKGVVLRETAPRKPDRRRRIRGLATRMRIIYTAVPDAATVIAAANAAAERARRARMRGQAAGTKRKGRSDFMTSGAVQTSRELPKGENMRQHTYQHTEDTPGRCAVCGTPLRNQRHIRTETPRD